MREGLFKLAAIAAAAWLLLCVAPGSHASIVRSTARVFTDRREPARSVRVDDLRVNETIGDEGGVRHLVLRGADGAFRVSFQDVSEVQFLQLRGYANGDVALYETRVYQRPDVIRLGVVQLHVLLGVSDGRSWYLRPRSMVDRGARLMKIVFGEGEGRPMPPETQEGPRAIAILPPLPAPAPPAARFLFTAK